MLTFSVQLIELELRHIRDASASFLDNLAPLNAAMRDLVSAADAGRTQPFFWQIPDADGRRVRTRTASDYEIGGGGAHQVFGELSFVWQLELLNALRQKAHRSIRVVGIASIKLRIVRASDNHLLAQWQVELGASDSPGCFFHSSAGQVDAPTPQLEFFPRTLPIPRLPTIFITPADALDFLLGELFQEGWRERQSNPDDALRGWSESQRQRLTSLLAWKAKIVREAKGSPWNWLKHQKPNTDLFVTT